MKILKNIYIIKMVVVKILISKSSLQTFDKSPNEVPRTLQ